MSLIGRNRGSQFCLVVTTTLPGGLMAQVSANGAGILQVFLATDQVVGVLCVGSYLYRSSMLPTVVTVFRKPAATLLFSSARKIEVGRMAMTMPGPFSADRDLQIRYMIVPCWDRVNTT